MNLEKLKNKKILILGLGKEGIDSYKFLRKILPENILGLADQMPFEKLEKKTKKVIKTDKKIKLHLGKNYLKALLKYDTVVKTPGISWKILKPFLKKRQEITSQTEIFFENFPGKIIGVTGTKGKGTTASLIYQILKNGGLKVNLVGNIGKPALSQLFKARTDSIFVYELSSHQLVNLKRSPGIAVLLNIFPAHLDYFKNFKEYVRAKENIAIYQKKDDIFIYPSVAKGGDEGKPEGGNFIEYPKNQSLVERIAQKTKAKKITFSFGNKNTDCYIKAGFIFYKNEKIFKMKDSPLKGEFNLLNIMPAVIIGRLFKIPAPKIAKGIKNFKTLAHRLEFVGSYHGIKFYNDSLATIPEATISAIKSFSEELQTIILGGFDSGLEYKNLAKEILKSKIKNLILFPPIGEKIWKALRQAQGKALRQNQGKKLPKHFFVNNMADAVKLAYQWTKKGKVCLLSPAAPSFGIFRDYKERGDLFKKYIKIYARCHNLNGSGQNNKKHN